VPASQEDYFDPEEHKLPVRGDFVEKLMQTVWTDDPLEEEEDNGQARKRLLLLPHSFMD